MTRVSCLMPTYNRREFLSLSVRSFLEQEWEDKELIVIDDGEDPAYLTFVDILGLTTDSTRGWSFIEHLWGSGNRLVYFHTPKRECLGWKWRRAAELATGDVFAYFPDDDWSHPRRLTTQVPVALRDGACLVQDVHYLDVQQGKAMILHSDSGLDGTLVWTREYYEKYGPFEENVQLAALFYQRGRPADVPHPTTFGPPATVHPEHFPRLPPPDFPLFVGTIHGGNMWDHRVRKTPIPFDALPKQVRDWYHACPKCRGVPSADPCDACGGSGHWDAGL